MLLAWRGLVTAACAGLCLLSVGAARAQDEQVQRGVEYYKQARFDEALEAFSQAMGQPIGRADFELTLRHRALIAHASGDEALRDASLVSLVSLDPSFEFSSGEAPPSLQKALADARSVVTAPLGLELEEQGSKAMQVRVVHDVAALVQRTRLWVRDGSRWRRQALVERPAEGESVSYYAEGLASGGTVVAELGTRADPKTLTAQRTAEPVGSPGPAVEEEGSLLWLWITLGVVVVGAGVGVGLVLASGDDSGSPTLGAPQVRW